MLVSISLLLGFNVGRFTESVPPRATLSCVVPERSGLSGIMSVEKKATHHHCCEENPLPDTFEPNCVGVLVGGDTNCWAVNCNGTVKVVEDR